MTSLALLSFLSARIYSVLVAPNDSCKLQILVPSKPINFFWQCCLVNENCYEIDSNPPITILLLQDVECIKEVIKYITEKTNQKASSLFEDPANEVGLLINERFINIPPQVSVPLLENLR